MTKQRVLVTAGATGIGWQIVKSGLCDVSKRQDIERMMVECVQALGGLDGARCIRVILSSISLLLRWLEPMCRS